MVTAPRAVVTLGGVGMVAGFGSQVIDLRGTLRVHETKTYAYRAPERIEGVVWHHSATTSESIKSIADYHVQSQKWPAIAYHYAIGSDGKTYWLNDDTRVSYHAGGYNARTIGIVLLGNYHRKGMTDAMKVSAKLLQDHIGEKYKLQYVWLHRDTKATACPGDSATVFLRPLQFGRKP